MPIESDRFPARLRPAARRLRAWAMTTGVALFILAASALTRGYSYLGGVSGGHPAESIMPVAAWAWVWVIIGLACLAAMVRPTTRWANIALAAAIGMHTLWACSFASTVLAGGFHRGWVTSINYATLAAFALAWRWLVGLVEDQQQLIESHRRFVETMRDFQRQEE